MCTRADLSEVGCIISATHYPTADYANQPRESSAKMWYLVTLGPSASTRAVSLLRKAICTMPTPQPELFAPRIVRLHGSKSSAPRRVSTPMLLNYAFLRASSEQLTELRRQCPFVNPIVNRAATPTPDQPRPYVVLTDSLVETFRRIAQAHSDSLPVYAPGEIDLTTADTVRVISGPFDGLTGRIVRQQGSSRCRIAIEIGNGYFASTLQIEPRFIAIEAFASRPRAIYDILDTYIRRRLLPLLAARADALTTSEKAPLQAFLQRFASADPDSAAPRLRAKLIAALYLTRRLLGYPEADLRTLQSVLRPLLPHLSTSPLLPYLTTE